MKPEFIYSVTDIKTREKLYENTNIKKVFKYAKQKGIIGA